MANRDVLPDHSCSHRTIAEWSELEAERDRLLSKWSETDALWIEAKAEVARLRDALDDKQRRLEPDGAGGFRWEAADMEAERDRARAENERLRRGVFEAVQKQEDLRSAIRRMQRFAVDAHNALTPGMKAGVSEARAALQACDEVARASDDSDAPKET